MEQVTKKCYGDCKLILPIENFGFNKNKKDGRLTMCRKCKSLSDKRYRERYPEFIRKRKHEYYERVKNTESYINYNKSRKRDYKKEYEQERGSSFRSMKSDLRKLILVYIKKQKNRLDFKEPTENILGISFEGFMEHISKQFLQGMSWENHGEWHIDHIIPCNMSNGDVNVLIKLFNYQNCQPMWGKDNLSKHSKIPNICCLWDSPFPEYNKPNP
jgi:hypothetical protein